MAELRRAEIHLGTRCNSRCVFCMSGVNRERREPWASSAVVRRELRYFRRRGCRAVGFLGGEPTVYPGLPDCVAFARDLGYRHISICSNGVRLADPSFCRELVEAGLTRVALSIHSHRAAVEDRRVSRLRGGHARKVAAVENLVALRRQGLLPDGVSLNPVLCRPTLKEMDAYLAFFAGKGVEDVRFNYIWPQGEVRADRAWVPSFREAVPEVVRVLLRSEKRSRVHLSFGGMPRCTLRLAGVSGRLLEHLAAKYLAEDGFDVPNEVSLATRRGPLTGRFHWQKVKKDVFKTKSPACAECRYDARCEGVWNGYARLYGLEELRPL